ncbi:MAG TPA: pantoate--beta-alanine ligase [Phycisphaerae bacterium]|nr:pantoate--beta-alanine ligase [Phycisphaerae bacterium]
MDVLHTVREVRAWRGERAGRGDGQRVPFVPTMGALHEGHASLVRRAAAMVEGGTVAASIFVNPTQFGPNEDFTKYPRTLEGDLKILKAEGCGMVFVPSAEEMYGSPPIDTAAAVTVDPGPLGMVLEGAIRPGHFRGVCTVVLKLLNIVSPTHLLLGQKDFQQQAILRRMCGHLNVPVEVVTCPTVREGDGLAMSSRNRYLSGDERARAVGLWEALSAAQQAYGEGERDGSALAKVMRQRLGARGVEVQYAVIADAGSLALFEGPIGRAAVALIAAKVGSTRLIDNLPLGDGG